MRKTHFPLRGSGNLLIAFLALAFIALESCGDHQNGNTGNSGTTTSTIEDNPPPADSLDFHYLRLDSTILVDSFYKKQAGGDPFHKLLFTYTVKDPSQYPGQLTLRAQGAKQNGDPQSGDPEELTIVADSIKRLPRNIDLPTLEITKLRLANLVGPNGTFRYQYILFIPIVVTKNGVNYLSYKLVLRPLLEEGDATSENLNPCPPYKPE